MDAYYVETHYAQLAALLGIPSPADLVEQGSMFRRNTPADHANSAHDLQLFIEGMTGKRPNEAWQAFHLFRRFLRSPAFFELDQRQFNRGFLGRP
jgi:hypothetical protein